VTPATGAPGVVRVYWRPGCPYCAMLRLGLRRSRLPVEEINLWEDRAAATAVRAITGGDETVPTVVAGTKAMVNPSARQVIAAVRAELPGIVPAAGAQPASWLARVAGLLTRRRPWPQAAADRSGESPAP
jgi:mycoredoxin